MRSGCEHRFIERPRARAHVHVCALVVSCALVITAASRGARADEPRSAGAPRKANTDTSYGRIEGDLGVVLGAGISIGPRAPRAALDVRLRYLDVVGAFFQYEDAPLIGSSSEPRRVMATGLEVRPLFLARWLAGRESSSDRFDLFVDSFGLELGAYFPQPVGASFASRPGLQAGIGLELPIFANASGPWIGLHSGVRWSDAVLGGDTVASPSDRSLYLAITLAWHQLFLAHAVDAGDRAPR